MLDVDLKGLAGGGLKLAERFGDEAYYVAVCIRSGMVRPELPHRVAKILLAFEHYGLLAGTVAVGAIRHGDRVALHDERGDVTYKELDERSNALANAWLDGGLKAGDGVAILVRNHRGFLDAVFAAAKCGARIVLLNTSFAGPQIREVAGREGTELLVYDDEYGQMLEGIEPPHGRWRAWTDGDASEDEDTIEKLIARGSTSSPAEALDRAQDRDPDQWHDRDAEGRSAFRAPLDVGRRRAARQGAVPCARDDRAVRSDVPRTRDRAHGAGPGARLEARRPAAL